MAKGKKKRKRNSDKSLPSPTTTVATASATESFSQASSDEHVATPAPADSSIPQTQTTLENTSTATLSPEHSETPSPDSLPRENTVNLQAPLWRRFGAMFYDVLFICIIATLLSAGSFGLFLVDFAQPLTESGMLESAPYASAIKELRASLMFGLFTSVLFAWLYFPLLESSKLGASVGKLIFQLRVVGEDGERCSFLRAHTRLCVLIATLGLGFLPALFRQDRRTLPERFSKTKTVLIS